MGFLIFDHFWHLSPLTGVCAGWFMLRINAKFSWVPLNRLKGRVLVKALIP